MGRGSLVVAAVSVLLATAASAQNYPDHPVTVVVPFAAGGPTDTVARLISEPMTASLGQQVIVENVGGAGGTLGAARVAKAEPDGYTLLLHHIGQATSVSLYRKLPYKPGEAFAPVGLVTDVPMTLVARADFPPNSVAELIEYLKANKDQVTLANAGIGSASHLCGMLLMDALDTSLTTVPYKGTGPAMTDLMGGQVDLMCDQTTNTSGQIKSGKIKGYAVTTKTPVPSLPELPTLDSAGLPGFEVAVWHGLYAPAGTPPQMVETLAGALRTALADPKVIERFADLGTQPVAAERATPAALDAQLQAEIGKWQPIVEAAGVYAD
jgi:tripartite-type tricarboxylate transporter receptor subunit TctC